MSLNEFISNAKVRGMARSSKYLVIIDMPRGPSANQNGVPNPLASLFRSGGATTADSFMNNFATRDGQYLASLNCEVTSLPSQNIDSKVQKVYGPGREIPYGRSYSPVNMSFYIDGGYQIKDFFERWQGMIFDHETSHLNYYNEYVTNVHILALDDREGRFSTGGLPDIGTLQNSVIISRYQCTLEECYPKSIAEVPLSASDNGIPRLQVQFQFRKWTNTSSLIGVGNVSSTISDAASVIYDASTGILSNAASGLRGSSPRNIDVDILPGNFNPFN